MKKTILLLSSVLLLSGWPAPRPRVLIIGDSISIGYFPFVKKELAPVADVVHNPGNAQSTINGLARIRQWLGNGKWDLIQFNWGLWDLAYRRPAPGKPMQEDKKHGKITCSLKDYARNLDSLVAILKATHARLVFVTTSYVPTGEPGRFTRDPERYNQVAVRIMKANGIAVNDIYRASEKIHRQYGLGDANVHYTRQGYRMLAPHIARFIKKELH
jgi:lysophospholipase L1-like esterase